MNREMNGKQVDDRPVHKKRKKTHRNVNIFYLNVGGTPFDVSGSTLAEIPFFEHLTRVTAEEFDGGDDDDFSCGCKLIKDRNDRYFVDRDCQPFADILTYLRAGNKKECLSRYAQDTHRLKRIREEADYYAMTELAEIIQNEYIPPPQGAKVGIRWVKCHQQGYWEVLSASAASASTKGDDNQLIECNRFPGDFEVKKSGAFLALFHHESVMPHLGNLNARLDDALPHLYFNDPRAGVDHAHDRRHVVRIGNIDSRAEKELKEDGVVYCTHSGVDVVEFQKRDMVSIANSVPKVQIPNQTLNLCPMAGPGITNGLMRQLALVQLDFNSSSPCRARLERIVKVDNQSSQVARWSELYNDGLVDVSDD